MIKSGHSAAPMQRTTSSDGTPNPDWQGHLPSQSEHKT